jgi:hypothetical protein
VYNVYMAKEKTPRYKSFGAIPRNKFASAPRESNKAASFREDMYNMSRPPASDDEQEYGHAPVQIEAPKILQSATLSALQKRIDYYEKDTQEDPNMRAMQLRQLRARKDEELQKLQDGNSSSVLEEREQDPATKRTGYWDKEFTNKTEEASLTPSDSDTEAAPLAGNKDPEQMKDQMARLVKKTGSLRKEAGLSDAEALQESADYKHLKSEISQIRYRINKILEDKGKEKYKEEITQLRHELATHLVAFKKLSREKAKTASEEADVTAYPPLTEEEEIDARNWEGLSTALKDLSAEEKPKQASDESEPEPAQVEMKRYEERRLARDEWKTAKETYMNAYEQHLSDVKNKAFWKKEEKSSALIEAERVYQEARNKYAQSLNSALESRAKRDPASEETDAPIVEEKLEGLQAGLANRFVLQAAHEKLDREKEYLPDAKSLRVFEKLQEKLKEHRHLIKRAGYVAVVGIGFVSGGVGTALLAFGSKAIGAKLAAVGAAGGATLGAYLGNSLSDTVINHTAQRRDSAAKRAQRTWSLETMDKREKEYIERYRSHEQALRDKGFYVGVGALAGGTLGAIAAGGGLDNATDVELGDIPDAPAVQAPDWPTQFAPLPDLGTLTPETPLPEQLDEAPIAEPVPEADEPKSVENFPKDEIFKNAPSVPEVSPDDVTYFEPPATVPEPELVPAVPAEPYHYVPDGTEDAEAAEESEDAEVEPVEILHTFEPGDPVDTVSEALFETWKEDNDTLEESMTKKEFLAQMYGAIAEIEKDPALNAELMEQMGIDSGDIDKVQVGQTINLQPFFEYMNQRN